MSTNCPSKMPADGKEQGDIESRKQLIDAFSEFKCGLKKDGITDSDIEDVFWRHVRIPSKLPHKSRLSSLCNHWRLILISLLLPCCIGYFVKTSETNFYDYFFHSPCLVDNNAILVDVTRPLTDCSICRGISSVPVRREISEEEFMKDFAFTGIPLLVKDGTKSWNALNTFSYDYFKKLYDRTNDAYGMTADQCQFFGYNTEFEGLEEAFHMSPSRANFKPGEKPWYFGWSNCVPEIAKELRNQYSKPYFLPSDAESSALDWIFMGGQGPGAFIHLDFVERPSWQAQIKGKKTWNLYPVPECESVCSSLNVTVETGDIFLIDTNKWFHSTFIHPGELSITIGSEYD